ncbi:hypothetical protein [Paracoccus nototheniae]|uniref:Uncharacterized protein n=1 Tax=Paracoccus nototheniae TaxID=2489002 RepID=A0ABW4DVK4_9RHOB|nr:hypothetical protein [Paracoccus nototheniae]
MGEQNHKRNIADSPKPFGSEIWMGVQLKYAPSDQNQGLHDVQENLVL